MIKKLSGFTLIEIIVATSLASLLFMAATGIYLISQATYQKADTKAETTQNGRVIIDRMIRELRQSQNIVTEMPATLSDPELLPDEIMFQDGHDTSQVNYIRYYLNEGGINRQKIVYYFDLAPEIYVVWDAIDQQGHSPIMEITEDKIIGEWVNDIEFWGDKLININLYLLKNGQSQIINTAVYGRNL